MTAPETTPAVGDCPVCGQGPTSAVHIVDCRPEPTPLEAAAEALVYEHGEDLHPDHRDEARAAATALLTGDWLERVLSEHQPVWNHAGNGYTEPRESWLVCSCNVDIWQWQQFYNENEADPDECMRAHQAAAIRAYATGVGL